MAFVEIEIKQPGQRRQSAPAIVPGLFASEETPMTYRSCFPQMTSLDIFETTTSGTPHSFSHKLLSTNVAGPFLTNATLEGQFDGQNLELSFRFEQNGVSLPYNAFAVLVATSNSVLAWYDLTNSCTGPGIGVFPGGHHKLPAVKALPPGTTHLHIVVWGRL